MALLIFCTVLSNATSVSLGVRPQSFYFMKTSTIINSKQTNKNWNQIANIRWIIAKARKFQKNIYFIDYAKAFDYVDHNVT